MKGYKVFNPDWTCNGFQYEVGKTYVHEGEIELCRRGFHFCENLSDCFVYYAFNPANKVAEIEASGAILSEEDSTKRCTDVITILREIEWDEVLKLCDSGNCNSGDWNSGDWNSGDWNSGNWNSGDWNSGDWNSGNWNSGNRNSGNWNSGNRNSGDCNSGNWNSGNCNSGNCNSGDWNSGNWNSGNRNSGDCNSGNWNSGDWNSGNCNSGDWNRIDFSNGCFNTKEEKINMFNKPANITYREWRQTRACLLLSSLPVSSTIWRYSYEMSDEEKKEYPEHITTGGYLKRTNVCNVQDWWSGLSDEDKNEILNLPNFDADIFEEITGVDVNE